MAGWAINTSAGVPAVNSASSVNFNSTYASCSGSTGALEVVGGFTAVNQALYVQDTLASPVNMSGQTVSIILDVTGGWNSASAQLYGAVFVQENTSPWACIYQNGTSLWNSSSTATDSGCVTLSITLPSTSTAVGSYSGYNVYNGTFDPTQVQIIGIQLGTGSGGTSFPAATIDIKSWLY